MESGIKIKESIESLIKIHSSNKDIGSQAVLSLTSDIERIDPKLQFYSWAMANASTTSYPDFSLSRAEDYCSFMANCIMMKKNNAIREGNIY